jgi:hypothetical protein
VRPARWLRRAAAPGAAAVLTLLAPPLAAQPPSDSAVVQAGSRYAAGALHRALFGSDYRHLWTLPIKVEALDLRTFAGGLTPTTAGGGFQTKSLRFRGGDGYQYGFRSVDKDPAVLPPEFAGTFVEDVVADQTSAQFPFAPAVAAGLMDAAGIPHTDPTLVILPDDPLLGSFRERFANTLGYIERRAIVESGRPGFAGALEIIDSDDLLTLRARGPANLVDARAFLRARLFDAWIGDWDRHPGQWTFARFTDTPPHAWTPIPEDRDQAFVRFDGTLLAVARLSVPILLEFGPSFGSAVGTGWNAREIDRLLLPVLPDAVWDSTAAALVAQLGDSAIAAGVARMPPEALALEGPRLVETLVARRDALPAFARRARAVLLREAELHATDAAEAVAVTRHADGRVDVTIADAAQPDVPYVRRTFDPAITRDLRIYLHGGADHVVVRGAGGPVVVRLIGGGDAVVIDSSSGPAVRLYAGGADRAAGPSRTHVDRRRDAGPRDERGRPFGYRDWGSLWTPTGWLAYGPDVGLFVGPGAQFTDYGFRKHPFASRTRFRAGWAFEAMTGRADLDLETRGENSRTRALLYARASGIEVVRYHGQGNETTLDEPDEFYRVRQQQLLLLPAVAFPFARHAEFGLGPSVEFIRTRGGDGRIVDVTNPYGSDDWGQLGGRARMQWDSRDDSHYPTRGLFARVDGAVFPAWWGVESTYGFIDGTLSGYLTGNEIPLRPTLALRAGGRKVWGAYPFFASAFIGDAGSVRLGRQHRYAGHASAYGNAELRLRLTRFFVILPGELGILGLADGGRVFAPGEESDRWHTAFGGGFWVALLQSRAVLSAALARSSERTGFYLGTGMAF